MENFFIFIPAVFIDVVLSSHGSFDMHIAIVCLNFDNWGVQGLADRSELLGRAVGPPGRDLPPVE